MRYAFFLAVLLLTMTQCTRQEPTLAGPIANLAGTWQLLEPASPYTITLQIALDTANPPHDITPFRASGQSSVNVYNVRLYVTLDGTMQADAVGSTKMAGSPEAMNVEQTYFTSLKAVVRYELTKTNQLRLYHGGVVPGVLVYEKLK